MCSWFFATGFRTNKFLQQAQWLSLHFKFHCKPTCEMRNGHLAEVNGEYFIFEALILPRDPSPP